MPEIDLSRAEWHRSSYSSQSGNCVEVARNLLGLVLKLFGGGLEQHAGVRAASRKVNGAVHGSGQLGRCSR